MGKIKNKRKIFIRFLKENNVYKNFINNVEGKYGFYKRFDELLFFATQGIYLNEVKGGFRWDKTKEGWKFWDNINNKWRDYYYKIKL